MLADVNVPNLPTYQMRIYDDGCRFLSDQIKRTGIYERSETILMCQLVGPGDTVLDIGANIGYYSLLASKLVGTEGSVFAFEPEIENFEILQWNIDNFGDNNTTCVNAGVSNYTGEATLNLCQDNPGGHHLHAPLEKTDTQNIQIVGIDDFLENKAEKIDFIKIDAQGAEQSILEGMKNTLAKNRDNLKVIFEFAPRALDASVGGLDLALETIHHSFDRFMFIDDSKMSVSEMPFDDIVTLGKRGLGSEHDLFANLLCFVGSDAYETVKQSL